MASSENTDDRTLCLSNIPTEKNTILDLYKYFCTFGNVINVVNDVNLGTASIIFERNFDARSALNSNVSPFNNRSIKMSMKLNQNKSAQPSTSDQDKHFPCDDCGRNFVSEWHLKQHIKRFHNGTGHPCSICKVTCTSEIMHKEHVQTQHSKSQTDNKKSLKFVMKRESTKQDNHVAKGTISLLQLELNMLKKKLEGDAKAHNKVVKTMKKDIKRLKKEINEKEALIKEKCTVLMEQEKSHSSLHKQVTDLMRNLCEERTEKQLLMNTLDAISNRYKE